MNPLNQELQKFIKQSEDFDFQGLKVQACYQGQRVVDIACGKTYSFYDIASLTKIVFTTLWFLEHSLCDPKILQRKVQGILPWYPHARVKVGQLLNHSAGNDWWQPFYKDISTSLSIEQRYQQMEKFCRQAPLSNGKKAVYSDIDFYLLGAIMQKLEGKPLLMIWQRLKAKFLGASDFHFNASNIRHRKLGDYAPTENCPWRKQVVRGQVHDENAWALGGVAPHAGLFGQIGDLFLYGQLIRKVWRGEHKILQRQDLKRFAARSMPKDQGDWGYGFMLPSEEKASAGDFFSKKSFGHTGFTGTSFWFDPERDLFVCILSNRVYPTRENKGFVRLRPQIHNWIFEHLKGRA